MVSVGPVGHCSFVVLSSFIPPSRSAIAQVSATEPANDPGPGGPPVVPQSSDYEAVLQQGFKGLSFPPAMETAYLHDKAVERLRLLRIGAVLAMVLSNGMLLTDWLMVPDQFDMALCLRLLVHTPLLLAWLFSVHRLGTASREWFGFCMSLVSAAIGMYLSIASTNAQGPPYLITLALILLFNTGVVRLRFWMTLRVNVVLLTFYAGALLLVRSMPLELMVAMTLVVVATALFVLHSGYWLEHEDRSNWLMLQHEHLLARVLQQGNAQLERLSRTDPLTELPNRRQFDEALSKVWARAQQSGSDVALLMMDVDHFKRYNDHYGHPAGDACLKDLAQVMARHLRQSEDLVARFGGEEFIAVLSNTSLPLAMAAAERVRAGIERLNRPHADSPGRQQVTISIGVACGRPGVALASSAALIHQADEALYQAKAGGRNAVFTVTHSA